MKSFKLLVLSLIITLAWSCNIKDTNKEEAINTKYQQFDQFFNNIENFSGSILVAVEGETVYSNSIGYANRELLVENTVDTKYRIGSISKPITALAVMILEEKGLLKTEEKLSVYISGLPISWENITVHQLLTHTSGLGHLTDFKETKELLLMPSSMEDAFEVFKKLPLVSSSGQNFHYSGIGYVVLTILIEKVSNTPYDIFVQEEIFKKLQMVNSGGDDPNKLIPYRADGYKVNTEGVVENADFNYMPAKRGAGNMISTVGDLLKLEKAFSTNILLSEEALNKMLTPYITDIDIGNHVKYGYGLDIVKNDSINMIFHTGGAPGFEALFCIYPKKNIVVIACANIRKNSAWRTDFQKLVYKTISEIE
jgi:CubicO group peptidase (beta-lactamase class C family)